MPGLLFNTRKSAKVPVTNEKVILVKNHINQVFNIILDINQLSTSGCYFSWSAETIYQVQVIMFKKQFVMDTIC